jgi:hypothetical protein
MYDMIMEQTSSGLSVWSLSSGFVVNLGTGINFGYMCSAFGGSNDILILILSVTGLVHQKWRKPVYAQERLPRFQIN